MQLLKIFLFLALFPACVEASTIKDIQCSTPSAGISLCEIQLEGQVLEGEKIFFSQGLDADKLFHNDKLLGSTGFLLNYSYSAPFLPRIYSLQPLHGQHNPRLQLTSYAYFPQATLHPTEIKLIDTTFPLRRLYRSLLFQSFAFLSLFAMTIFLVLRMRRTTIDGWMYPLEELRWFFGSTCTFMILGSPWSHLAVPGLWNANLHELCRNISLAISIWALSSLLLGVRFNDRSCVVRGIYRKPSKHYSQLSDVTFVVVLIGIVSPWHLSTHKTLLLQSAPLLLAMYASIRSLEWKRALKRSGSSPLCFHFSLMFMAVAASISPIIHFMGGSTPLLSLSGWLVLALGAWRMHRYLLAKRRSHSLVRECRKNLAQFRSGSQRLMALCEFIEDEWGAARVSVISVEGSLGLLLASAGPDAIPINPRVSAKKLGPFLRRVCREGHILYAPVAEELGQDLQDQGLKHSSLALPFHQQDKVRAVLCMMADEGERIPPMDATVLDLMAQELSLEILSATAQHVAEEKCARLLAIARQSDGIAVEHLDEWGHLHYNSQEEGRFLVGAKLEENLSESLALRKVQTQFKKEIRAIWHALALEFEFVPKEIKDDFWVLSPKEFRHPYLRQLGSAKAALFLSMALDRHARALAAKEGYLLLGQPGTKIVAGNVKLQIISYGTQSGGLDVIPEDLRELEQIRERATNSGPLCQGNFGSLETDNFQVQLFPLGSSQEIFSLLAVQADKKEVRKLENKALETAKESLRKAA